MRPVFAVALLVGTFAGLPAVAGEGAAPPFNGQIPPTGVVSRMSMVSGGKKAPFKWSSAPVRSRYTEVLGAKTDPFRWSASPLKPAPAAHASAARASASHQPASHQPVSWMPDSQVSGSLAFPGAG